MSNSTSLGEAYKKLVDSEILCFTVMPDGMVKENLILTDWDTGIANIVPGTFNPRHEAHDWMYQHALHPASFEVSLQKWDKPNVSLEDLTTCLKQFEEYAPVVVTAQARMIAKIGVVRQLVFQAPVVHLGIDTFERMLPDYTVSGIAGLAATFVVYDRQVGDTVHTFDPKEVPYNVIKGISNPNLLGVSSTNIRARRALGEKK